MNFFTQKPLQNKRADVTGRAVVGNGGGWSGKDMIRVAGCGLVYLVPSGLK